MARILIADDHKEITAQLQMQLSAFHHEVTALNDLKKILGELKKNSYHLLILDLVTPGAEISGIEILRAIRKWDRDLPIIVITGYGNLENMRELFVEYEIQDYLQKPVSFEVLSKSIKKILHNKYRFDENKDEGFQIHVGNRIRYYRKKQALTLTQLGRRLQISSSKLSKIEKGKLNIDLLMLHHIATAVKCRVIDLIYPF